jgi:phage shock protein A
LNKNLRNSEGNGLTVKYLKIVAVFACMFFLGGCGSLTRLQNNMEQMTYYMGMMASSMPQLNQHTGRMANSAERLEARTNQLVEDFQKKGTSAERAVQNYTQTFIDNDKAIAKNLLGIKQEISELKQGQLTPSGRQDSPDQVKINASISERISRLEAQIAALNAKLK